MHVYKINVIVEGMVMLIIHVYTHTVLYTHQGR